VSQEGSSLIASFHLIFKTLKRKMQQQIAKHN
jgi:hypothetical protein